MGVRISDIPVEEHDVVEGGLNDGVVGRGFRDVEIDGSGCASGSAGWGGRRTVNGLAVDEWCEYMGES